MAFSLQGVFSTIGSTVRGAVQSAAAAATPKPGPSREGGDGVTLSDEAREDMRIAGQIHEGVRRFHQRTTPPVGGVGSPLPGPMQMRALDAQAEALIDALVQALQHQQRLPRASMGMGGAAAAAGLAQVSMLDQKAAQVISAQTQLALQRKLPRIGNPGTRAAMRRLRQALKQGAGTPGVGFALQAYQAQRQLTATLGGKAQPQAGPLGR